jgi:hypothetical protein
MLVRGPGIAKGSNFSQVSGNVDLMPTMLHIAAGEAYTEAAGLDGRSMAGFLLPGIQGASCPFQPHFNPISIQFQPHFNPTSTPFQAHFNPISTPSTQGASSNAKWRDAFLNEYLSVGTYWNDHSTCWENDANSTTKQCGGPMPRGPQKGGQPGSDCVESEGIGDGNCYFVDSTHSNTWRQLRIINATMNW